MSLWARLLRKLWRRLEPEPVKAASQPKPERTLAEITERHNASALSQEERDRAERARLLIGEPFDQGQYVTVNFGIDVESNRLTGEMWQYTAGGRRKPVDPGVQLAIRAPE